MQAVALFLAALLGASALHKLLARERLVAVTARLAGVGLSSGTLLLALAATLEALAALALLVPALRLGGACAAAVLWLGYALALGRHRGQVLDCGCDLIAREKPVDAFAIARPLLLAALAAFAALAPASDWTLDTPFAALALLALWFAAGELHSIPKLTRHRP
jgi:uncharacterized membrane protein YphA (DoxX/SURF4 family)